MKSSDFLFFQYASDNSFIATGDTNRFLQIALIQMRRLMMSRLIRIFAVFQFYI